MYLGRQVTRDTDKMKDMKRRVGMSWCTFNINKFFDRQFKYEKENESIILRVLTYGRKTWISFKGIDKNTARDSKGSNVCRIN